MKSAASNYLDTEAIAMSPVRSKATVASPSQAHSQSNPKSKIQNPKLQDACLWILLVGPLVAPLFMWMGWGILRPFADGIYLLGEIVCPKVDVHLEFLGYPVAVCSSCWAAVWSLWTVRLLYGRAGEGFGRFARLGLSPFWEWWHGVAPSMKLAVLFAGFVPWALDVALYDAHAWYSPHSFMMLAGYIGGFVAAILVLPAAAEMRARLSE